MSSFLLQHGIPSDQLSDIELPVFSPIGDQKDQIEKEIGAMKDKLAETARLIKKQKNIRTWSGNAKNQIR